MRKTATPAINPVTLRQTSRWSGSKTISSLYEEKVSDGDGKKVKINIKQEKKPLTGKKAKEKGVIIPRH